MTSFNGCVGGRTNRKKETKQDKLIDNLTVEIENLNTELINSQMEKEQEVDRLREAQQELIVKLKQEIDAKDAEVKVSEKGLVITFLAQIFFDSGKAEIKKQGQQAISKIVGVLKDRRAYR